MQQCGFDEVHNRLELDRLGLRIYLAHIPIGIRSFEYEHDYERAYKPEFTKAPPAYDIFLCGHVHEKWKRRGSIINVGVDQWDFRPVTLYELLEEEEKKQSVP